MPYYARAYLTSSDFLQSTAIPIIVNDVNIIDEKSIVEYYASNLFAYSLGLGGYLFDQAVSDKAYDIYCPFDMWPASRKCFPKFIDSTNEFVQYIDTKPYLKSLGKYAGSAPPGEIPIIAYEAYYIDVIVINRFYYWFSEVENFKKLYNFPYDTMFPELDFDLKDKTLSISYSFGKLIIIKKFNQFNFDGYEIVRGCVKSSISHEYKETFSNAIEIDGGYFYKKGKIDEGSITPSFIEKFFPFPFVNEYTNERIQGDYNWVNQGNFQIPTIPFAAPGENLLVCADPQKPPTSTVLNLIKCSSNVGFENYVEVYQNASSPIFTLQDFQICGNPNATYIALILRKNQTIASFFSDFTALTSESVKIYAYNFRYIKYTVKNGQSESYEAFIDNGSVATTTTILDNQVLDLSKYLSLKDDKGLVTAITFKFLIYASSESENNFYFLDIPINVPLPSVSDVVTDTANTLKRIIKTQYATHIRYYLGSDSTNTTTVAVTNIETDGSNQQTTITLPSNVQSTTINIVAYNYFYQLNGETRTAYISKLFSAPIEVTPIISSLKIEVKIGGTAQTIYNGEGDNFATVGTSILITDCNQNSFVDPYRLFLNYTSDSDIYFYFTYTLAAGYSSLYFQIGSIFELVPLQSAQPTIIKKSKLFERLDSQGKITLTLWLDKKIPFNFDFIIKNTSSNSPNITAVSTPKIISQSFAKIKLSFSTSYQYCDLIRYTIKDNLDREILSAISLAKENYQTLYSIFSAGTTVSKSVETSFFDVVNDPSSIKVLVQGFNLNSASPFAIQVDSMESSSVSFPKRLNIKNPAEIIFYEDELKTSIATLASKNKEFYAFLQLYDFAGSEILEANYDQYISTAFEPKFKPVESQDKNTDLDDLVSVTRITDYFYKILIKSDSKFDDTAFVLDISYSPILENPPTEKPQTKIKFKTIQ